MFFSLLDLLRQSGELPARFRSSEGPAITISDQGDHLLVQVQLEGIDPKTVQVQLGESGLAIAGARTLERRTEGADYFIMESSVSGFHRVLPLPVVIDPHRATSEWQPNGSLALRLPKR